MRLDYKLVANVLHQIGPAAAPEIVKTIQRSWPSWSQPDSAEYIVRSALRSNSLENPDHIRNWFKRTVDGSGVWELRPGVPLPELDVSKPARGQITYIKALFALQQLGTPSSVDEILEKIQSLYVIHMSEHTRKTLDVALRNNCAEY
jgi:hypothetical protein